jgi:hypothetical protein
MPEGGYTRVLPRDLFNEADLLKCMARLCIFLDDTPDHVASLEDDMEAGAPFDVQQSMTSGAIYVANIPFSVSGEAYDLYRPLNSRQPWPLWCGPSHGEGEAIRVFSEEGLLSEDMLSLIRG